jgi:signal transduction histidine kinase
MFTNARLKLTALYVLIVAIIVFGFSVFLYQSIGSNLRDASDDDFAGHDSHQHFVSNTLDSLQYELLFADLVIIITSAGLSYVLAGRTLRPIQKSVEAQKVFAANASHELRTPLTVMRNDIEVFLRNISQTKEQASKTMNSNLEEIERMSGIVENLLLLARSDNASVPVLVPLDASTLVKTMIKKMQSSADKKNIQLISKLPDSLMIKGNNALLERAILNILQNSIEHTPQYGSITFEMIQKDSQAIIRIIDTGSGIDEKDLPNIFTRFYKAESSNGSGLGLSIVKEIIDQHHGSISIESIKNKGTTVIIHLPMA